jgi:hypothetical protein
MDNLRIAPSGVPCPGRRVANTNGMTTTRYGDPAAQPRAVDTAVSTFQLLHCSGRCSFYSHRQAAIEMRNQSHVRTRDSSMELRLCEISRLRICLCLNITLTLVFHQIRRLRAVRAPVFEVSGAAVVLSRPRVGDIRLRGRHKRTECRRARRGTNEPTALAGHPGQIPGQSPHLRSFDLKSTGAAMRMAAPNEPTATARRVTRWASRRRCANPERR